jgi:MFS family permease
MTVHVPFLLFALFLLWFPRQWMRLGAAFFRRSLRSRERRRATQEPWNTRPSGDPRVLFTEEFAKIRNYIDLLRAAVGSLMLTGKMGLPAALEVGPEAGRNVARLLLIATAVIPLVGLVIQTTRYERGRLTFYPPIFYLAGVTLGLCDWRAALFAFALIWAINPGIGSAQGFLTVYAALVMVFGILVFRSGGMLAAILAGVFCFLPALLSLLAKRPLIIMSRKASRTGATP